MFMVLSYDTSHFESSPGSSDEYMTHFSNQFLYIQLKHVRERVITVAYST